MITTLFELEKKLKEESLESVYFGNILKKYIPGEKLFVNGEQMENMPNVYGVYKNTDNYYVFFVTDEERGIEQKSRICSTEEEACDALYKYISREKDIYEEKKIMNSIVKSIDVSKSIQENILGGVKIPHSTSQPVIRKENDKYYLAAFVFYYNREDLQRNKVDRPTTWAIADIVTGEIIERRDTRELDFSDAPYDVKYNILPDKKYDLSKEYYEKAYQHLDNVREQIIIENTFNFFEYNIYLSMIIENIPESYKRFYKELSM